MKFGDALNQVQEASLTEETTKIITGLRLPGWNARTAVRVQKKADKAQPYLYKQSNKGTSPFTPTQEELFATNWQVATRNKKGTWCPPNCNV